jgi:pimeloyl-ACP methyl ester carboxylesterase
MTTYLSDAVETQYLEAENATYAYRRFGVSGGVPLVLFHRFRATMDHWDPAFLDVLGAERDVIISDKRGFGLSTGAPATSVSEHVDAAIEFTGTLGLQQADLLGWSLGGHVAQGVALARPDLVRRLVVAGSGPGRVPGARQMAEDIAVHAMGPDPQDEDYLILFFGDSEQERAAGIASLRRLDTRLATTKSVVTPEALRAEVQVISTFPGWYDRVSELAMPVLVANGLNDVMVDPQESWAMAQRLPNGKLVTYSDAGHAFLFQHAEDFGQEVLRFLR